MEHSPSNLHNAPRGAGASHRMPDGAHLRVNVIRGAAAAARPSAAQAGAGGDGATAAALAAAIGGLRCAAHLMTPLEALDAAEKAAQAVLATATSGGGGTAAAAAAEGRFESPMASRIVRLVTGGGPPPPEKQPYLAAVQRHAADGAATAQEATSAAAAAAAARPAARPRVGRAPSGGTVLAGSLASLLDRGRAGANVGNQRVSTRNMHDKVLESWLRWILDRSDHAIGTLRYLTRDMIEAARHPDNDMARRFLLRRTMWPSVEALYVWGQYLCIEGTCTLGHVQHCLENFLIVCQQATGRHAREVLCSLDHHGNEVTMSIKAAVRLVIVERLAANPDVPNGALRSCMMTDGDKLQILYALASTWCFDAASFLTPAVYLGAPIVEHWGIVVCLLASTFALRPATLANVQWSDMQFIVANGRNVGLRLQQRHLKGGKSAPFQPFTRTVFELSKGECTLKCVVTAALAYAMRLGAVSPGAVSACSTGIVKIAPSMRNILVAGKPQTAHGRTNNDLEPERSTSSVPMFYQPGSVAVTGKSKATTAYAFGAPLGSGLLTGSTPLEQIMTSKVTEISNHAGVFCMSFYDWGRRSTPAYGVLRRVFMAGRSEPLLQDYDAEKTLHGWNRNSNALELIYALHLKPLLALLVGTEAWKNAPRTEAGFASAMVAAGAWQFRALKENNPECFAAYWTQEKLQEAVDQGQITLREGAFPADLVRAALSRSRHLQRLKRDRFLAGGAETVDAKAAAELEAEAG